MFNLARPLTIQILLFCRDKQILSVKVSPIHPSVSQKPEIPTLPLCSASLQPPLINILPKSHDLPPYLLLVKTPANTSLLDQFTQWPQQKCLGGRCDISSLCQSALLTHSLFSGLISQLKLIYLLKRQNLISHCLTFGNKPQLQPKEHAIKWKPWQRRASFYS